MKVIATLFILLLPALKSPAVQPDTQRLLNAWITMQNNGSDKAVRQFIDSYYSPDMLSKMKNYDSHVAFYKQIIQEFGKVQSTVYLTETDSEHKLKVQLIKEGRALVPEPSPEEILVVEIDLDPENPKYLSRGLGLGALICYIKR